MKKRLLITFDYELFLGKRSGTVYNCLLKPTRLVLDTLDKYQIKHAIFFVDTLYLLRLKQEGSPLCQEDLESVRAQLKEIVKKGHYIFPHLHSHWLDAKYISELNQWDLSDISRYRLSIVEPVLAHALLSDSVAFLKQICREASVNYKIDAYRAGGWCIQPFDFFEPLFKEQGIRFDFSVLKGTKNTSKLCYYDFSKAPLADIYRFNADVLNEDDKGPYCEFTISSLNIAVFEKWINKFLLKYLSIAKNHNFGDGISNSFSSDQQNTAKKEMVSIELLTSAKLKSYKLFLRNNNYMHFISHPKMLSEHNISSFSRFLGEAVTKYTLETNYKNMVAGAIV